MNEGMHMMRRTCGLSAAVLLMGLVAYILAGCFGGGKEPVATTSQVTVPSSGTTISTVQVTTTEASTLIDGLPREYAESIGKRPIVVLFYVPGGVDDEKVLSVVRGLRGSFSSYTFLMYDYRVPAAYGDLSQKLEVDYPPETVLIDRGGNTRDVWSGYVDNGTLNQSLITLGRY
jgi:hypothetical protein